MKFFSDLFYSCFRKIYFWFCVIKILFTFFTDSDALRSLNSLSSDISFAISFDSSNDGLNDRFKV